MATGQDIIEQAFDEAGIHTAEQDIQAADLQLALKKLNNMLAEWDEAGRNMGFTPLASLADEVRISRGLHNSVIVLLAGRLCTAFSRPITQELASAISAANKALLRIKVRLGDVKLPSTLPKGSGNHSTSVYNSRFFDENDKSNF